MKDARFLAGADFLANPAARALLALLNGDGEEARVIGGAVRNTLLGVPVADIDICTTATPDVVTARASAARYKTIPTGIEHGTVTVVIGGVPFEVTTLREDIETDGRRARVRFGRDFKADALRRDFTINALGCDALGNLHDYCGGLADIAARRVRFIGEASQRIAEDYLRILRFFRFHAAYGAGELDAAGLAACIAAREGMAQLSRERVRVEMLKLLAAPRGPEAARAMAEAGILGPLLGGAPYSARLARLTEIEAAHGERSDALLRLAAVAVATPLDAERVSDRLRLSNAEATRLGKLAEALPDFHRAIGAPPAYGALRELLFRHGRQGAMDAARLSQAGMGVSASDAKWLSALRFLRDTPEPRLPFGGADIVARGVPGGKAVGEALKRLQAAWIRAGFPQEPAVLARLLESALDGSG